jgi:hypothetical protein
MLRVRKRLIGGNRVEKEWRMEINIKIILLKIFKIKVVILIQMIK